MGLGMEIGVDLGTSSVLVYIRGKGIVLKEPSVVAVNSKTGKVLAVGESASLMLGRTPGIVEAIRPLREGVISDFRATEVMLKAFIGRVCTGLRATYFKPTIVVCVPSVITPVEQQAVENACRHAGAKDVFLIREPIAAAIGAGIDITKACGSMVVITEGTQTTIVGLKYVARRPVQTLPINALSITSVALKSEITPSRSGLMASTIPGVRPSISEADSPTAKTLPVLLLTATTEGSLRTIPLPLI